MRQHAIVIDTAMLGSEAWTYLGRLCASSPSQAVVVCTGPTSVAQRVRGLRLGADDWVTKPCHPEEVLARVEGALRARQAGATTAESAGPGRGGRARDPARHVRGLRGRPVARSHAQGVRAAGAAGRVAGPRDPARADLRAGVGLPDGARRPLRRRLRPQAAAQARGRLARLAVRAHAFRSRLQVRRPRGRRRGPGRATSPLVRVPPPEGSRSPRGIFMARLSLVPKDREFFRLFDEAGANILRAAPAAGPADEVVARGRWARPGHPDLRAGGRPDHARHHPPAEQHVGDADRPRGHLLARLGAGRRRRLHRGGRRLHGPLQHRGPDGAGAAAHARFSKRPAATSPRRSRGCAGSRTSTTTSSRSTGSRTKATASRARRWPLCSRAASTRWS